MKTRKYSLYVDDIDNAAKEFISSKESCEINISDKEDGKLKVIEIIRRKEKGIINCYIIGGQVSHNIQGKPSLHSVCEECWEYIVTNTSIPSTDKKCFSIQNVNYEDFKIFINLISENSDVKVVVKEINRDKNIRHQYYLEGKYGAHISLIFYENNTLYVQGAVTAFYIEIITELMSLLSSAPDCLIEEFFESSPAVACTIDPDLHVHFKKMDVIEGTIFETFIRTSIALINSGIVVEDYGCYSFAIMKALEGLMHKKFQEDHLEYKDFGSLFVPFPNGKYYFSPTVKTYDNNDSLKKTLEVAYNFYKDNRHTTFHVDRKNLETSRILSYSDALEIIKKAISIINDLCVKW